MEEKWKKIWKGKFEFLSNHNRLASLGKLQYMRERKESFKYLVLVTIAFGFVLKFYCLLFFSKNRFVLKWWVFLFLRVVAFNGWTHPSDFSHWMNGPWSPLAIQVGRQHHPDRFRHLLLRWIESQHRRFQLGIINPLSHSIAKCWIAKLIWVFVMTILGRCGRSFESLGSSTWIIGVICSFPGERNCISNRFFS